MVDFFVLKIYAFVSMQCFAEPPSFDSMSKLIGGQDLWYSQSPILLRAIKIDNILTDIDEEYRTTFINFAKYKLVMFAMAKLMEMESTEQNKVALYLFNLT